MRIPRLLALARSICTSASAGCCTRSVHYHKQAAVSGVLLHLFCGAIQLRVVLRRAQHHLHRQPAGGAGSAGSWKAKMLVPFDVVHRPLQIACTADAERALPQRQVDAAMPDAVPSLPLMIQRLSVSGMRL